MRKVIYLFALSVLLSGCTFVSQSTNNSTIINLALEDGNRDVNNHSVGFTFYTPHNSRIEALTKQTIKVQISGIDYYLHVNTIKYLIDSDLIEQNEQGGYTIKNDQTNLNAVLIETIDEEVEEVEKEIENTELIKSYQESDLLVYEEEYEDNNFVFILKNKELYNVIAINNHSSIQTTVSKKNLHNSVYYVTLLHDNIKINSSSALADLKGINKIKTDKEIIDLNSGTQVVNSQYVSETNTKYQISSSFNNKFEEESNLSDFWVKPSRKLTEEEKQELEKDAGE